MDQPWLKEKVLRYPREYRELWRERRLQCEWFREYKDLFDCDDLRLAFRRDTKTYEFGEWFTAITFARKGYSVLQPNYTNPNKEVKYSKAVKVLGEKNVRWLRARKGKPDLLVYKGKEFFFVEVKVEGDTLKDWGRRTLKQIAKRLRCKVFVYHLKANR